MKTPRYVLLTLIALVGLVDRSANAVSIVATSGGMFLNVNTPIPFSDVVISLSGADFSLTNFVLESDFVLPAALQTFYTPGMLVDLSGRATLGAPKDTLIYDGVAYHVVSGTINVSASPGPIVDTVSSAPFTMSGALQGQSLAGPETVDATLTGGGFVGAGFEKYYVEPLLLLQSVNYLVTTPEPATWLLLVSGLAGLGLSRLRAARSVEPES